MPKLPDGSTVDQIPAMIQSLLSERFGLKFHREPREQPVYMLVVGKPPLKLKDSPVDKDAPCSDSRREHLGDGQRRGVAVNLGNGSSYTFAGGKFEGKKIAGRVLADVLERYTDRPVDRRDGPERRVYDFSFAVTPEDYQTLLIRAAVNSGVFLPPQALRMLDNGGDPLGDALSQLGLKLESRKAPVDLLIVDQILRYTHGQLTRRSRHEFTLVGQPDQHAHPFVARPPGGNPQLQVVAGHDGRTILERQRPGGSLPICDARNRSASRAAISRTRRPRSRTTAPGTLPVIDVRGSPGPIGVREHVEVRQRRALEIRRELLEVVVGLAGKADDDVRADRGVRHPRADVVHERRVVRDRVRPAHRRQHPVARVLQRQMKVRREAAGRGDEIDDLARAVHRLERADAEQDARLAADGTSSSARSSSTATTRGVRSRPYEPRCTPVSAISLKPAAAIRSTSREHRRRAARSAARRASSG